MKLFLVAFCAGLVLAGATGAQAYHRFWARCNDDSPTFMTTMTRDAAQDYANAARYEGYQWGGGCWNYDDVDSYPYDAPGDPSAHGEGGDCSGLTFKTWRESTDDGATAGTTGVPCATCTARTPPETSRTVSARPTTSSPRRPRA